MPISDRLSSIRRAIRSSSSQQEDERLLQLYWNRAELKKELTRLQEERRKILEQVKKAEGSAARAREQLDALESHLANPEAATHALVYFQLRGLWRACSTRLARFAEQLHKQQEDRERRRQLIEFDQARRQQLADLDRRLLDAQSAVDMLEAQLKLMEAKLASMRGFWNYFRRRRLSEEITLEREKWDRAVEQVTDLSDDRAALESTPPPEFPGISIDGRRIVNTAVIAYAQQLAGDLSKGGLAMLAKETTAKRVFDVNYGARAETDRLLVLLHEAVASIASDNDDLGGLKERTDRLRASANYRSDADTVPLTDSIGTLPVPVAPVSGLETVNRAGINVLIDDYWDLYQSLMQ
jgi:hypothetical protein